MDFTELSAAPPVIEALRVVLRNLRPDDAADVFGYASDPEVSQYMGWEPHASLEDTRAFLQSVQEWVSLGRGFEWAIEHKVDRKVIGTFAYLNWETASIAAPAWAMR